MTKYFYLKLGNGNCLAEYWLGKDNVCERPVAAIYFGTNTVKDLEELAELYDEGGNSKAKALERFRHKLKLNKENDKDSRPDLEAAINFVRAGKDPLNTVFITITPKNVYIYKPESEVFDLQDDDKHGEYDEDLSKLSEDGGIDAVTKQNIKDMKVRPESQSEIKHIPKIMPVKDVKNYKIKEVPHVLASLPCNQYLTRGTCREIKPKKNCGVIQAVKCCLGLDIDIPNNATKLMNFLSPHELETLVFLILKNAGLFVPAWRGGTQKGFDMIAYNLTGSAIEIPRITFESKDNPESSLTFQVKKGKVKKRSEFADFTIATEYDDDDNRILNADWLLERIREQSDTRDWFVNLLYWVPGILSFFDR